MSQPPAAPRKRRVAVVFGGRSSEHAVSCMTAAGVLRAIDRTRYDVVPVGIAPDGRWVLAPDDPAALEAHGALLPAVDESGASVLVPTSTSDRALTTLRPGEVPTTLGDVDVVFPLLHGPFGEDGTIQGLLELGEVEVVGGHDFYDFAAKYVDEGDVRLTCPADVPTSVRDQVQSLAVRAFEVLGCEGLARVDVFWTPGGEVVVNEINTMPGFTPHSMYPRMWAASGVDYPALVDRLLRLALTRPTGLR